MLKIYQLNNLVMRDMNSLLLMNQVRRFLRMFEMTEFESTKIPTKNGDIFHLFGRRQVEGYFFRLTREENEVWL